MVEPAVGAGADPELAEDYAVELRGGHGDGDVLDVTWRGLDVGLLVREGDGWVAVLHSTDESSAGRRETAEAALRDLVAMQAQAMSYCGWCGCPTDRAGREEVYTDEAEVALCAGCRAERDGETAHHCGQEV